MVSLNHLPLDLRSKKLYTCIIFWATWINEGDMDLKLNGKRALVTGSSAGLGEAIARLLAQEGVTVVVHGRDARRAHAVAEAIS
ncbi:SDR family NAD(P)-dependent oxidoreductase, partial [Burkholderia gladioli]